MPQSHSELNGWHVGDRFAKIKSEQIWTIEHILSFPGHHISYVAATLRPGTTFHFFPLDKNIQKILHHSVVFR